MFTLVGFVQIAVVNRWVVFSLFLLFVYFFFKYRMIFSAIFSRSNKTAELQRLLLPLFLSVSVKVDVNSPRSIWLRGFRDKTAHFSRLYCLVISMRDLSTKKTKRKYRKMTRKPRSHVRILIHRTWAIILISANCDVFRIWSKVSDYEELARGLRW